MGVVEWCCVIFTLVATKTDHVACNFVVTPKNVCANPGEDVMLQCILDGDVLPYWKHQSEALSKNGTIKEKYKNDYALIRKDLYILQLDLNAAGTYGCQDSYLLKQSNAEVIVIENSPQITSNASGHIILENEIIRYTCEVRYAGNLKPSMRWTLTRHDLHIKHKTDNQPGLARTYIEVTGNPLTNGKSFICTLFFEEPMVSDDLVASNAPDYTKKTNSGILTVHYKPRNTRMTLINGSIVDSDATVYIGDVLQCQTESNPQHVNYEWIALAGNKSEVLGYSRTIILQKDQLGITSIRCTVTNFMGSNLSTEGSDAIVVIVNVISTHEPLVTTPDNACTLLGESVVLNCSHDKQTPLSWLLPNGSHIVDSGKVSPTIIQSYPLKVSGEFSNAGTYTCMNKGINAASTAELIVLGQIIMTTFPEDGEIQEGDPIQYTCKATYAGSFNASFQWSPSGDVTGTQFDGTDLSGVRTVISQIEIKRDKPKNNMTYSCKLVFSKDHVIYGKDVAINVPGCSSQSSSKPLTMIGRRVTDPVYPGLPTAQSHIIDEIQTPLICATVIICIILICRFRYSTCCCKDRPRYHGMDNEMDMVEMEMVRETNAQRIKFIQPMPTSTRKALQCTRTAKN